MHPVLVFMLIAAVIWLVVFSIRAAAERRKQLAAWAREQGLAFSGDRDRDLDDRHRHFGCLRRGHSRHASNVMRGELAGLPVTAFDFRYVTGHGKNRRHHHLSAVIARSGIPLQHLYLRPENVLDRVGEFLGADDIDFESAEFSRKFFIKARDRKWAYAVIHQGMMDYLLQAPRFSVQFDVGEIIAWRSRRLAPADFAAAADLIRGLLDRLPAYLVQDLKGRAAERTDP